MPITMTRGRSAKRKHDRAATRICAIDLFCGAGGLTRGLLDARINVVAGFDQDPSCEYPYTRNQPVVFRLADVTKIVGTELSALYPPGAVRLLAGCAPCQPFSTYTQGKNPRTNPKWQMIRQFERLVRETKPELVTMENVPRLQRQGEFRGFVRSLRGQGYHVTFAVVRCEDYGVPQLRRRLVLLASRLGTVSLPSPSGPHMSVRTVGNALTRAHLEPLEAGQESKTDVLHRASSLSPKNLKRIRASVPGGSWRDWPAHLQANCHRRRPGRKYVSVYGRLRPDKPSPTITTQFHGFGSGRFGHPFQDRAITPREAALLQTFPRNYRFVEPGKSVHIGTLARLIGNAVPVLLAKAIGRAIRDHVRSAGIVVRRGKSRA